MVFFVHSDEVASLNIASCLKELLDLEDAGEFGGLPHSSNGNLHMIKIPGRLIGAEFLNGIVNDDVVFLSRHSSSKGIPAFTVHAEGNWSGDVSLGGKPNELSVAAPLSMLKVLACISSLNAEGIEVTYEATHHGPFLDRPSLFVELGGNEEIISSKRHAKMLAKAVACSLERTVEFDKVAVGIGGMHYSGKFSGLALKGMYAFGHIMPKYHIGSRYMIPKAFERNKQKPEIAVIEWKSIKAADREMIVRELNCLGIDYAKV